MIISKNGKTYDTSDGTEQFCLEPLPRGLTVDQAAKGRWEDEGGPVNEPPLSVAGSHEAKPAWSVLSLRHLKEAIKREALAKGRWEDD